MMDQHSSATQGHLAVGKTETLSGSTGADISLVNIKYKAASCNTKYDGSTRQKVI